MWNLDPFRLRQLQLLAALSLPLGTAAVLACGPSFSVQVLDDRTATLRATPSNSFAYEATHLVVARDKLQAHESEGNPPEDAEVKAMRAQGDGDAAFTLGSEVAPALRLYTAAAVDYLAAAAADAKASKPAELLARAEQRFQAVLDLPAAEGAPRAVWAAYMLGQLHGAAMTGAGNQAAVERSKAIAAYTLARTRAVAGAPDPLGLAVAGLGEQARLYLVGAGQQCSYSDFMNATPCADAIAPGDLKEAIRLYAEQAARSSGSGVNSLVHIANWALADARRTQALVADPLAQRLLVSYALARVGDIVGNSSDSATDYYYAGKPGYADAGIGPGNSDARDGAVTLNPMLQTLATALQALPAEQLSGVDRVAALAYRSGNYPLAQALAGKQRTALSAWVRAKLALRRGDAAAAAAAYAEAVRAFPQVDASVEPMTMLQLRAEQGVLTLSRGQYVEAFAQLYAVTAASNADITLSSPVFGDYMGDTVYLAERVLTTDELKRYVDARLPATAVPPPPVAGAGAGAGAVPSTDVYWKWLSEHPRQLSDQMRQILARRLVRDGRIAEALPYFPDDKDWRYRDIGYGESGPAVSSVQPRALAKAYGVALYTAQHAWRATTRAQAWYRAARLAREHGMEIMAAEQGPDHAEFGGMLAFGYGRIDMPGEAATPAARAARDLADPYVTDEERRRYAASEVRPYQRYHYRNVAVGHIQRAADELPPRSQAFAAVLCQGVAMAPYDAVLAPQLYRRYVKEGAAVPFAVDFGQQCVEPDFAAAARFPYVQLWRHKRLVALTAGGVLLVLVAGWLLMRRRQRGRQQQ